MEPPLSYDCLKQKDFHLDGYTLTSIRAEDMFAIMDWRNAQMEVLRQREPLTREGQVRYFEQVVFPDFPTLKPKQILLSFLLDGVLIGYGGLTNLSWADKRGEVSCLFETSIARDEALYLKHLRPYVRLLKELAFQDIGLHRLFTETYDLRPRHVALFESEGFVYEGRMRDHVIRNGRYVDSLLHGCINPMANVHKEKRRNDYVLVSSVARKSPLVAALKQASTKFRPAIGVMGGDADSNALARYSCDDFWLMPLLKNYSTEDYIAHCHQNHIRFILPTRDGELLYYAERKETFQQAGIAVMVSSTATVERCLDKLLFYNWYADLGFPVIPTKEQAGAVGEQGLVVKERFGAGALKIGINLSHEAATKHSTGLQFPIYQPFISGEEASIDIYVTREGKAKGIVLRKREVVVQGESQQTTTFHNEGLAQLAQAFAESGGFYGHIILQVITDSFGKHHIIECNPRFGGASTLALAAGLDSFYWFLLEARDEDLNRYSYQFQDDVRYRQIRLPMDKVEVFREQL